MVAIPLVYENKNIGKCLRCIRQSHDRTPHQGMGKTPISWTRVFRPHHKKYFIWNQWIINSKKCSREKNAMPTLCVWEIPSCLLQQNPVLMEIGAFLTINQHVTPSSMENIYQIS